MWDQNSGLPQILKDSAGNSYVYGLDLISRTASAGSQEYYLSDGLGSTTGITDGSGAVADTYQYDVFGANRSRTGTSTSEFTFTGEQTDPSGLQYLRARYYDPATGRFIGKDPLPLLQRYAYVRNNPANFTDPSGLCPAFICAVRDLVDATPARNARFLFDFLTGAGDGTRYYGQNAPETIDMRNSMGAGFIRSRFVANDCSDVNDVGYGTQAAAWDTLVNPATADPFSTAAQVGGFAGASVRRNGSGGITITIPNEAGAKSFFYHRVPNVPWSHGPLRTISQRFQWSEPLPEKCRGKE